MSIKYRLGAIMIADDIKTVKKILSEKYHNIKIRNDYGWQNPSLNVIDCVLSLNRKYRGFARPRVENFQKRHPRIHDLEGLKRLIKKFDTPLHFSAETLNYKDEMRSIILLEVIEYLLFEIKNISAATQYKKIQKWANAARPGDAFFTGIYGFGLAGFQYLRMLFGAQTIKPDVHIIKFVSKVLYRDKVKNAYALVVLERAGKELNLPLRELDNAIWKEFSKKK